MQPQARPKHPQNRVGKEKKPLCFRSDQRFFCRQPSCPLRRDCMKLVAEWLR